jgi:hypothetical protein
VPSRIEVDGEERMLHRNADHVIGLMSFCTRTTQQMRALGDGWKAGGVITISSAAAGRLVFTA